VSCDGAFALNVFLLLAFSDVGIMDEEGFVFMKDRSKNMLIRGGENM
jgi:acyl-CoA synthetase (AMP-forming)/AMP-acid ligase II